jgi:cysteine desulfurase / selenocysteine lyase
LIDSDYDERVKNLLDSTPECYFNHGGCSFVTPQTLDAVTTHLGLEHRLGNAMADLMTAAEKRTLYKLAAATVGADAKDIAITDSHTTGWEKAFQAISLKAGDIILTTRSELGGNWRYLRQKADKCGAWVMPIPSTENGSVCLKSLADMLNGRIKLISVSWIGSNGGHIEPVEDIGQLAEQHGIPYFVDASQVVGQMPVDIQRIRCDVLTTPGRKWLRGPKGTGFMYLRPSFLEKCQSSGAFDGWRDSADHLTAKHFEASNASVALQMGLLEALDQLQKTGIEQIQEQILARSRRIWEELQAIHGVICLRDTAPDHGMVSFNVAELIPSVVRERLMSAGIEVAANQAEFTPLDMQTRQLDGVVRVTPHACTTWEEIEMLVDAIRELSQTGQ